MKYLNRVPSQISYKFVEVLFLVIASTTVFFSSSFIVHTAILFALLAAIAWIDWRSYRIPNILSLTLLVTGLMVSFVTDPPSLHLHIFAALVGYGFFRLVDIGYIHFRGRTGLGMGDAKLFGAIGAWLGPEGMVPVLFIAAISALIFGLLKLIFKPRSHINKIPFGPFLALGAFAIWVWIHLWS